MERPLVAHVLYSLDFGGLENGLVNIINRMPQDQFRHAIIAYSKITEFSKRIKNPQTQFFALGHTGGQTLKLLPKIHRLFRTLRPDIVHTRNLTTLDAQLAASCFGSIRRVHGEHGWDVGDLGGENLKHLRLRKTFKHFTHRQIALSSHTEKYLLEKVGVKASCVTKICNGVDTEKFMPNLAPPSDWGQHIPESAMVFGTVGRASGVKNQPLLISAFAKLLKERGQSADCAKSADRLFKLVMVGDGPDLASNKKLASDLGVANDVWFTGARNDIPEFLANFDVFVLPSLSEGISNSILEAMASGVVVVASNVGGNPELVDESIGHLFESKNLDELTQIFISLADQPERCKQLSASSRRRAVERFSIDTMVNSYGDVYAQLLNSKRTS